jgi:predicted TIM-barrel fold metal-dependent hydrolase
MVPPRICKGAIVSLRNLTTFLYIAAALGSAAAQGSEHYAMADFEKLRKFDAHVHANTPDHVFLDIARKDNFELLSINVDYPDFPSLPVQADVAHALQAADPARFHFATTFSMKGFGSADWAQATNQHINDEFARGAVAVKVWKNIGMVEKDAAGKKIMLDDKGFDGVMANIEAHGKVLIAHQAEPKNCWLPLDQMTTENDRSYFREHPEYYMFLHPEEPSYETLIAARDRFLARHPKLNFDGAHMGSLEWSVDELARFLDRFPNANVDLAARMTQVQYQSVRDYQKVRRFFIRYQDRLMYGSDLSENPEDPHARAQNPPVTQQPFGDEADQFWRSDWKYLATDESQRIDAIRADAPGLALPKSVIDKIYYTNARRAFHLH